MADEPGVEPHCGYVAIVGRPNVGKSTLLNHLLGQKLSITSRKPQTTRHNMLGIKTRGTHQFIFVDTPGLHSGQGKAINQYMNRSAESAIKDVDVVVFVVDRTLWTEADEKVCAQLKSLKQPVIIAINKIDKVQQHDLLAHVQFLNEQLPGATIIPISALQSTGLDELEAQLAGYLPEGVHLFPSDQITDRSERFLVAEIIREKITRQLGAELPYETTVEIETFTSKGKVIHINALIWVAREGQKKIIIGDQGSRMKKIGQQARMDVEKLLDSKVMLTLWVKVRKGWSDDERALKSLGYGDAHANRK